MVLWKIAWKERGNGCFFKGMEEVWGKLNSVGKSSNLWMLESILTLVSNKTDWIHHDFSSNDRNDLNLIWAIRLKHLWESTFLCTYIYNVSRFTFLALVIEKNRNNQPLKANQVNCFKILTSDWWKTFFFLPPKPLDSLLHQSYLM